MNKTKPHSNADYHLSAGEIARLLAVQINLRDHLIIRTFVETGMRRSELADFDVSDIDWDRSTVLVRNGKGGRQRVIPLRRSLLDDLRSLVGDRCEGSLFASRSGGHLSPRQINRIVSAIGRSANVRSPNPNQSQVTPHLLRHSFARLWKARRGSIETLSRILGHTSVKTTWDLYGTEGIQDVRRNYDSTIRKMFNVRRDR